MKELPKIYICLFKTGHIYTQRDLPVLFSEQEALSVPQWVQDCGGELIEANIVIDLDSAPINCSHVRPLKGFFLRF